MKRNISALGLVLALICLPAIASAGSVVGTWSLSGMAMNGKDQPLPPGLSMVLTFKANGKFNAEMSFNGKAENDAGSYTVKGNKLTTKTKKSTDTSTFKVSGAKLVIESKGAKMTFSKGAAKKKKK